MRAISIIYLLLWQTDAKYTKYFEYFRRTIQRHTISRAKRNRRSRIRYERISLLCHSNHIKMWIRKLPVAQTRSTIAICVLYAFEFPFCLPRISVFLFVFPSLQRQSLSCSPHTNHHSNQMRTKYKLLGKFISAAENMAIHLFDGSMLSYHTYHYISILEYDPHTHCITMPDANAHVLFTRTSFVVEFNQFKYLLVQWMRVFAKTFVTPTRAILFFGCLM